MKHFKVLLEVVLATASEKTLEGAKEKIMTYMKNLARNHVFLSRSGKALRYHTREHAAELAAKSRSDIRTCARIGFRIRSGRKATTLIDRINNPRILAI